ncbi:MAG: 23S rRNA (adenine(2503)-C(2))-methyltransferase RlmN, partial [Rhodospirillaceae bacterium]|nr:23S rRNA (adenine(2503)-C(2))-methyltransferase RlmN [Rhodospirillaceae bacterium]
PAIRQCGADLGVNLAISLHAVTDELRDIIMPINKKYPLKELVQACREYPGSNNARRITFEYIMLDGINDSPADAKQLARLVKGIPAKFNLIPFNKWPGADYDCSSDKAMSRFAEILNDAGYSAPVRKPRGRDILAACGQLKSDSERERMSLLKARRAAGIEDDAHPA